MDELLKELAEAIHLDEIYQDTLAPVFVQMEGRGLKHPSIEEAKEFCLDLYAAKLTEDEIKQLIKIQTSEIMKKVYSLQRTMFTTVGTWMYQEIQNLNKTEDYQD